MRPAPRRPSGPRVFASLCLPLLALACASPPRWISTLPEVGEPGVSLEELHGTYVRTVESRYSVADRSVGWQGREWIEVGESQPNAYAKIHLYAEHTRTHARQVAYVEKGTVEIRGSWVLLRPASAHKREWREARSGSGPLSLPGAEPGDGWRSLSVPPLVHHYDARERSLTPATFERFGELFEHGIHEGCASPFDTRHPAFRAATEQYNHKVFHRHGYFRAATPLDQAPRKRNVLSPMRSRSPSWSALGRSRRLWLRYVGAPVDRS